MSFLVFAAVSALFSMPGLGGDEEGIEVPAATELWKATVVDETLTETELTEFSWDGYTHIQGQLGAGTISIRFSEIDEVVFEPVEKNKSVALVTLKNGKTKKITVDGRVNLYGKTDFGNYKILVKDLRRLDLRGGPKPRASLTPKSTPAAAAEPEAAPPEKPAGKASP